VRKALFTSAVRQLCDRLRLESQEIRKRSYGWPTNSQRLTIYRYRNVARWISTYHISIFFAICLRFLEIARLPNEFVRQSYEFVQQPCERRTKLTMTLGLDIIHLAYLVVVIILHSVDNMPPKKGDSLKGNMLACNKYALKCIM